jgi:hypothetical protein
MWKRIVVLEQLNRSALYEYIVRRYSYNIIYRCVNLGSNSSLTLLGNDVPEIFIEVVVTVCAKSKDQ